jgi:DNA mismatch endonuclease (patch repair protein)
MQQQRRRDTSSELALRRASHRLGLRYKVDAPLPVVGLRRRADLLFTGARIAVFVDGCFWHGCPVHGTEPKNNAEWWKEKFETNRRRDGDTDSRLGHAGWLSVRVWEHDDMSAAAERLADQVRSRSR